MPSKKKPVVKIVETFESEPEPPPVITEVEPTNREVINYVNNTMLQIIACMDQKKSEAVEEFKRLLEASKPAPVKSISWYKKWDAWVLTVFVLAAIGYGIYLLIMVESGKRIVLPWVL